MLLDEFKKNKYVSSFHMAFRANDEADRVIFLYKFIKGESPGSFGMNVARLAGLPASVIEKAKYRSQAF